MNWVWFLIGATGGLYAKGALKARRKRRQRINAQPEVISEEERAGQALLSGNVDSMISILDETQDPILRNALLGQIIAEYYRQRSDADAKEAFYRYAQQHVEEIPGILKTLEERGGAVPFRGNLQIPLDSVVASVPAYCPSARRAKYF